MRRPAPAHWPFVPNRKSGVLPVGDDGKGLGLDVALRRCSRSTCLPVSRSKAAMISLTAASSSGFEPISHHTTRSAAFAPSGATASIAARTAIRLHMLSPRSARIPSISWLVPGNISRQKPI
jgi:hypothetical protein